MTHYVLYPKVCIREKARFEKRVFVQCDACAQGQVET